MARLRRLAGWLPAVILPSATLDQLLMIIRSGNSENVSALTWALFFLANVGALYLGKPEDKIAKFQMALAFGFTAILDVVIVILTILHKTAAV